ncbi:hypothetical protein PTKIN_Ptkin10aG0187500 [Pterospermum kingtungense]
MTDEVTRVFPSIELLDEGEKNYEAALIAQFVDCDRILEGGPWHIQNHPLILRKWKAELEILDFSMDRLPIWFELHNVPLELFNQKGISYIASAIGNPLYTDKFTALQQRLVFAKVCVKVEACAKIPKEIEVVMRSGKVMKKKSVQQQQWVPKKTTSKSFLIPEEKCMDSEVLKEDMIVNNASFIESKADLKGKSPVIQSEGSIARKGLMVDLSSATGGSSSNSLPHADSVNRFEKLREELPLDEVIQDEDVLEHDDKENESLSLLNVENRLQRASALGVKHLMQNIIVQPRKSSVNKKKKTTKASKAGGTSNSPS